MELKREKFVVEGIRVHIPLNQTMATLFEATALKYPAKIGIIFEGLRMSWNEVDQRANQMAQFLRSATQIKPDSIVALCLERSELMVIAILGVWKAGGAYVALDPNYPRERINFILQDTGSALILTDDSNCSKMKSQIEECIDYNGVIKKLTLLNVNDASSYPSNQPESIGTTSDHMSHVLYTSGTTGHPKGVIVIHKALLNECLDYPQRYNLKEDEVIVLFLNYVFNAFSVPLVLSLSNGYPLVIVRPSMLFETQKFYTYLSSNAITHVDSTPSLLNQLELSRLPSIRRVAPGGEVLTHEVFKHVMTSIPNVSVYNIYANSEGTLCCMYACVKQNAYTKAFSHAATNKKCFILTESLELADIDAVGELGIVGTGLARGYLNNEALTRDRFLPNPFQTDEEKSQGRNTILYRTGDLVRQLSDGSIEFVGRRDFQIKIRGYRIELGEIETVMTNFSGISAAIVIPKNLDKSEEAFLIGYFVFKGQRSTGDLCNDVLTHIRNTLPEYMVPNMLIQLNEIPLTRNGKIDRSALPEIVTHAHALVEQNGKTVHFGVPMNSIITQLSKIWREILNLPESETEGLDYDFFEFGGNSLLAIRLVERVNKELGMSLDASHVFNYSTITEFTTNMVKDKEE